MAYMTDKNGNYKRTVRCSYCYQLGHNKSSCPKNKEQLKENVEYYKEELAKCERAPDNWQRQSLERSLERCQKQLKKMENRGKNRKCGYCGLAGHTRRTCQKRKDDVQEMTTTTIDLRMGVAKKMAEAGLGPGSLIRTRYYRSGETILSMVTKVRIEDVLAENKVSNSRYHRPVNSGLEIKYVVAQKNPWDESYNSDGFTDIPMQYLNIDDIPREKWVNERNYGDELFEIVSTVNIEPSDLLEAHHTDHSTVSKFVLNNCVDPR
jgi:hypothetical protein